MNPNQLVEVIKARYNVSELRSLAFEIGLKPDEVYHTSTTISAMAIDIVQYCQRRDLLQRLVDKINKDRRMALSVKDEPLVDSKPVKESDIIRLLDEAEESLRQARKSLREKGIF